jgi:D-glycero-alpha-D-manno-heptose-7-phosphate kinase
MIICRTPYRISFFGGGTDYPGWYRAHGGSVLACTIDKYCYLTCRFLPPFFEHRIRLVYRRIELCQRVEEIEHPAVRAILQFLNIDEGIELHHDGDLPARSGIGSSSAFTVGLLHALHALCGRLPTQYQLTQESLHVEQTLLNETVGSQDQAMAAYGGLRYVRFMQNGDILANPVPLAGERLRELREHLMLFFTGISRTASDVARSYVNNIEDHHRQLRLMQALVGEALAILTTGQDIRGFGRLLHEAWQAKRSLSAQVSNPAVDELYQAARSAGALGGKLTGAGGGGFLLLFVPPENHDDVRAALGNLVQVPFEFENYGSQIIFADKRAADLRPARRTAPAGSFQGIVHAA